LPQGWVANVQLSGVWPTWFIKYKCIVIPAKAGIQANIEAASPVDWIPAYAGMTP